MSATLKALKEFADKVSYHIARTDNGHDGCWYNVVEAEEKLQAAIDADLAPPVIKPAQLPTTWDWLNAILGTLAEIACLVILYWIDWRLVLVLCLYTAQKFITNGSNLRLVAWLKHKAHELHVKNLPLG